MDIIYITPVAGSRLPRSRWCLKRFASEVHDVLITWLYGRFRNKLPISGQLGNGRNVEGFRAPAGVRKSHMYDPRGLRR